MKKFEVGKRYYTRSICDHNCIWRYEVIARTEKTVTLKDEYRQIRKFRISVIPNPETESCKPLGTYSMCPILTADREVA